MHQLHAVVHRKEEQSMSFTAGGKAETAEIMMHRVTTLMRMPCEAATPVPTMTAVGVARPRAQGQAMTSTAMPNSRAKRK